jgi:Ca-activated chloride channel homolog
MKAKVMFSILCVYLYVFFGCGKKNDDWLYYPKDDKDEVLQMSKMTMPSSNSPGKNIGFSVGGAKDIGVFRENIRNNYLPVLTDITYEGLFYGYYFETGQTEKCDKLFCPSYSYAVSNDPFSKEKEYYLSVGLNSGIKESDFKRKKLNLVVVLDISGSMSLPFDKYYYDQFGNKKEVLDESGKTKIEIAARSVNLLLDCLNENDRFGMVLFDNDAHTAKPINLIKETDIESLKDHILQIMPRGGTNMDAGLNLGTSLFEKYKDIDKNEYENRIIFLTDAMPNIGETTESGLFRTTSNNASEGIFTTFIGIGVDFNTELIEYITKIRGANYYSVHSEKNFKKVLAEGFDYMVTPLVFDLKLIVQSDGYKIEKVYGSPEANESTGEIMKINTLFPSKTKEEETRGGIVLLKLKKISNENKPIKLRVTYKDRNGKVDASEKEFSIESKENEFYQNTGIRKGILLSRYVSLMKNWIIDERLANLKKIKIIPAVNYKMGIVLPKELDILGKWERQSVPLTIHNEYKDLFFSFNKHFTDEMNVLKDTVLKQESELMNKIIRK